MSVVALRDIEPGEEVLNIINNIITVAEANILLVLFRCLSVIITASAAHLLGQFKILFNTQFCHIYI